MKRSEFLAFVAPCIVVMLSLLLVPLLMSLVLSLGQLDDAGVLHPVGLANYAAILEDERFHDALGFTLLYVVVSIPIHTALGFALAIALDRMPRWSHNVLISLLAMPFVMTPIVGTLIFSWFFKDYFGLFPWLLGHVGIHVDWLGEVWPARWTLILWGIWWSTGFNVMVLFAGLQTLDRDQLHAAEIDGASGAQQLRHIVLPHLLPFFVLITTFNVMDSYRIFDNVYVMTRGGPGTSTETLEFYNYQVSFVLQDLGRGAAVSMLDVAGILILLVPLLVWSARLRNANG